MGGCFEDYTIQAKDWAGLKKKFQGIAEQCRWENGHSYSGGIGMKNSVVDRTREGMVFGSDSEFADPDMAYNHCSDLNDKWGPAWAYRTGPETWFVGGWCSS